MKCKRCFGRMISERVLYQGRVYSMRKCLMCGDLVDWIILLNRTDPAGIQKVLSRTTEERLQEEVQAQRS